MLLGWTEDCHRIWNDFWLLPCIHRWRFWPWLTIDYRCDEHLFVFLVVRPQLSTPNPNFSKPRTKTANSDFSSWLTHQFLGRLKFTNPNLQIYLPKMANSEKLGLGIDNPCRIVFWVWGWTSAWRGLMTGIFGILESSAATQWYQDCAQPKTFFIVTSIVYGENHHHAFCFQNSRLVVWICNLRKRRGFYARIH